MLLRTKAEIKYDWRRMSSFLESPRIKKIFPEIIDSVHFCEQPYTIFGTRRINEKLKKSNKTLFITGPCVLPPVDVKRVISIAKSKMEDKLTGDEYIEKLKEILNKQPSLQNVVSVGNAIDNGKDVKNDILCVMETQQIAHLLANNNEDLFKKYEETLLSIAVKTAERIERFIENYRKMMGVKSRIIYFYSHGEEEKNIIDNIVNSLAKNGTKPRDDAYFHIENWTDTKKVQVEIVYTRLFIDKINEFLHNNYDMIVLCENYKHFYQISKSFVLPIEYFATDMIGIIPLPSIESEKEMDISKPLYLGKMNEDILNSVNRFSLGSYLLSLTSSKDLESLYPLLEKLFKYKLSPDEKILFLEMARSLFLEKINLLIKN